MRAHAQPREQAKQFLRRAAALVQEITLLVPAIDLAETLGGERQDQIDQILEILDEIEALSQPG